MKQLEESKERRLALEPRQPATKSKPSNNNNSDLRDVIEEKGLDVEKIREAKLKIEREA